MEQWYTFHSKPNAEYQVVAALRERGIQTYLPEIKTVQTASSPSVKPFFPCYLFGKIDFENVSITQIQWTPGLRRIITFDDYPTPIPNEIIELIQKKLSEFESTLEKPTYSFKKGDTVQITDGPFQDMLAIFNGPVTVAERVQVLLNILGQASRVQVEVSQLKEVPSALANTEIKQPRRTRGRGRRIKKSHSI